MKALSLTQPWATLIALGAKRIETRSWTTNYRGPLAIHAAKSFPMGAQAQCALPIFHDALHLHGYPPEPRLPRGVIVATCELIAVKLISRESFGWQWEGPTGRLHSYPYTERELAFGDFSPGRYAWLLADVKPLATPIPAQGALGLWEWIQ
jgi:hypothetical protein